MPGATCVKVNCSGGTSQLPVQKTLPVTELMGAPPEIVTCTCTCPPLSLVLMMLAITHGVWVGVLVRVGVRVTVLVRVLVLVRVFVAVYVLVGRLVLVGVSVSLGLYSAARPSGLPVFMDDALACP
jgi:hypothetical protein